MGGHREERESTELAWWPCGASSTGFKSGFWCPLTPSPPNQTNAALSDLLWPLRHVLFLTPSWNWLSSSKNQVPRSSLSPYLTPVPCEERVNIFFIYLVFFLCVLGWVCVWSQGVSCGHPRLGAYLAALDLGPTILPLAPLTPLGSYQPPFTRATLPPEHVFRTCH